MVELRACPGERVLIVGNHDGDLVALAEPGFTTRHRVALYDAEPALALSHEPLRAVPVGAVNAHGHLHEGTEPTHRHVNLAVERCGYEPLPMTAVVPSLLVLPQKRELTRGEATGTARRRCGRRTGVLRGSPSSIVSRLS